MLIREGLRDDESLDDDIYKKYQVEKMFFGDLFGVILHRGQNGRVFLIILNDDGHWFEMKTSSGFYDVYWFRDLLDVLEYAKIWSENNKVT
jgi:hypothetical protein